MKQYIHFSLEERETIEDRLSEGVKPYRIAMELRRAPSSVTREIERNSMVFPKSKNGLREKYKEDYIYRSGRADTKYLARHTEASWRAPLKNPQVFAYVVEKLRSEERWSPDIIAGMLRQEYSNDPSMRICQETIYAFAYTKKGEELKLKQCFLRAHRKRRKHSGRKTRRTLIPNRVDISLRPKEVEDRETIGHWEGDSVVGVGTGSALHTEIERMSRFLMVKKLPRKTAEFTKQAMTELFSSIPEGLRRTITLDNGCEFTRHTEFTKVLNIPVYFARPYHSWERGSNENGNGMIRRYFPKGTNFNHISEEQIQMIVNQINTRPRKILGYKSAAQVFHEHFPLLTI